MLALMIGDIVGGGANLSRDGEQVVTVGSRFLSGLVKLPTRMVKSVF